MHNGARPDHAAPAVLGPTHLFLTGGVAGARGLFERVAAQHAYVAAPVV